MWSKSKKEEKKSKMSSAAFQEEEKKSQQGELLHSLFFLILFLGTDFSFSYLFFFFFSSFLTYNTFCVGYTDGTHTHRFAQIHTHRLSQNLGCVPICWKRGKKKRRLGFFLHFLCRRGGKKKRVFLPFSWAYLKTGNAGKAQKKRESFPQYIVMSTINDKQFIQFQHWNEMK